MTASPYSFRRRYRYRYRKSGNAKNAAIGIAVAAVAAGALSHPHGLPRTVHSAPRHVQAGIPARTVDVPVTAGPGTPAGWARALLAGDSLPVTSCNVNAVTAWEHAEGGGFGNQASFNPLNVNPGAGTPWPGHPAIGAWAFPDAATGLRYTVATLGNGYYGGILAALRAGGSAQAVCNAIMASPWAQSHYYGNLTAAC